mgnify:CR=1 FL=1
MAIIANNANTDTGAASRAGSLVFVRSLSNTLGSTTLVTDDVGLGGISWVGADGSNYFSQAASITAFVDGSSGSAQMPGRIVFSTTAAGGDGATERMRLDSSGDLTFAQATTISTSGSSLTLAPATDLIVTNSSPTNVNFFTVRASDGNGGFNISPITQLASGNATYIIQDFDEITLTGSNPTTYDLVDVFRIQSNRYTATNAGQTITNARTLYLEPVLTGSAGGNTPTITTASTLYISSGGTAGATNYAIWVDAGASRFDGTIDASNGDRGFGIGNLADVERIAYQSSTFSFLTDGNANAGIAAGTLTIDGDLDFTGPQEISTSSGTLTLTPGDDVEIYKTADEPMFTMHRNAVGQWEWSLLYSPQGSGLAAGALELKSISASKEFAILSHLNAIAFKVQATTGDAYFLGDLTAASYADNSDRRVKTNIQTLPSALDKVSQLRGVSFDYLWGDKESKIGLIAQEVESVIPEVVSVSSQPIIINEGTSDEEEITEVKTISYGNLVAYLVEAIKELKGEIDKLQEA